MVLYIVFSYRLLTILASRKMATNDSITSGNNFPSNYHTVVIDGDLPNIDKDYKIEDVKNLPPPEYWLNKMEKKDNKECYKIQHVITNGLC